MKKMKRLNKTKLAKSMGISRGTLYYKSKMNIRDQIIKEQIISTLRDHPAYGHKRIAIYLGFNKKRILRVMKKYKLNPLIKRSKKPRKKDDLGKKAMSYINWLKRLCPFAPNVFWATDFTYMWFQGRFYYLATVIDVYTREIIGVAISPYHNKELVLNAFKNALIKNEVPDYLHSDQGSEYTSEAYVSFAESLGCIISMSSKGKPWENGFQESFYSQFKLELGKLARFQHLGELVEAIYCQIHYYNYKRIHTKLKMPPAIYAKQYSRY